LFKEVTTPPIHLVSYLDETKTHKGKPQIYQKVKKKNLEKGREVDRNRNHRVRRGKGPEREEVCPI
jgi:hypothetical protein